MRLLQLNIDNFKGISFGPVPPNIRDHSRGQRIVSACIILIILITLITGSRLLIKGLHQKLKWGWDDWFIIPAAVRHAISLVRSNARSVTEPFET